MFFLFPGDRTLLEMEKKKHGFTYGIRNENAMDLNEIGTVLDVIAIKRMSRAGKGSVWSHHPFELSNKYTENASS